MAEISQSMPQFQYPDLLGSYLRGISVPGQLQAQQQQNEAGALNIDQLRMAVGTQQMYQDVARGSLQQQGLLPGGPSAGQQMGAEAQGGPTGGIQNGPQGLIGQSPANGGLMFSPGTSAALAALKGQDPNAAYMENIGAQQKLKALQLQSPMNLAQSVISSSDAAAMVRSNQSLLAGFQQYAPRLGLKINPNDPTDPNVLNSLNARRAATLYYNDMAASIGQSGKEMPNQEQTRTLPDGTILQQSPLSGAITAPYKPELQKTIGPDGQPVLTPGSAAAGKKPFESTVYAADQLSPGAVQTAADFFRTNGKMPEGFSRNPLAAGKVYAQAASDMTASGDTMGAINARAAGLNANKEALEQVTKVQTASAGYAATIDKNLTSLTALQGKVDSNGIPIINKAYRAWQQGITGSADVAQAVIYLNSIQGEFAKLKSGSLGNQPATDTAMKDAADTINKYIPAETIAGAAIGMRGEAKNRMSAIAEQVSTVTKALGVNAPTASNPNSSPNTAAPRMNAQGWVLHKDARGNQAYVSPDGKQYQEVH
jgi:hypothetical protein